MNYIERINELFDLHFGDQTMKRFFPAEESDAFSHLESMESRHQTYWDLNFKVKIYSNEYGQQHIENLLKFKNSGAPYLNKYWLASHCDDDAYYFLFSMVPGKDMLFELIDDFSIDRACHFIRVALESIETNMLASDEYGYLMAHDYKLFNTIHYQDQAICFDYDVISRIDTVEPLYREFWHKLEVDDLAAPTLGIAPEVQKQILDEFQNEREQFN